MGVYYIIYGNRVLICLQEDSEQVSFPLRWWLFVTWMKEYSEIAPLKISSAIIVANRCTISHSQLRLIYGRHFRFDMILAQHDSGNPVLRDSRPAGNPMQLASYWSVLLKSQEKLEAMFMQHFRRPTKNIMVFLKVTCSVYQKELFFYHSCLNIGLKYGPQALFKVLELGKRPDAWGWFVPWRFDFSATNFLFD